MAGLGRGSCISLQDMCTSVAAQALVRSGWDGFELELSAHAVVVSQLEHFEMLRRMCGPRILAYVVHRCPQLLTDKLLLLLVAPRTRTVNLPECSAISAVALVHWIACSTCTSSELRNPEAACVTMTRAITKLDVSGCGGLFTDMAPESFANRFLPQHAFLLTTIDVSRTSVDDLFVKVLLRCCMHLHTLGLSACANVTDNVFDFVEIDYPVLVDEADVAWQVVQDLGDAGPGVASDTSVGRELTCVDLSGNRELSYRAVRKLAYICQERLTTLNIEFCGNIDMQVLLCLCGYIIIFPDDIIKVVRVDTLVHGGDQEQCLPNLFSGHLRLFTPRISDLNVTGVLQDSRLGEVSFSQLSRDTAPTLRRLACACLQCPDFTLPVNELRGIEDLNIMGVNSAFPDIDLFCKQTNNIRHLNLLGVRSVSGRDVVKLCRSSARPWVSLRCDSDEIDDTQLMELLELSASTLEELDLWWCDDLTDESLSKAIQLCKSLRKFDCRNVQIGLQVMDALIQSKPSCLTDLGLMSSADILLDTHLVEIVPALPNLMRIDLGWNCHIGNDSVRCLLFGCPLLTSLSLAGVKLLTAEPFWPMVVISRPDDEEMGVPVDSHTMAVIKDDPQVYIRRSTVYATNLCHLDVTSCDDVCDEQLMTLARVAYGTLTIIDFYAARMTPRGRVRDQCEV